MVPSSITPDIAGLRALSHPVRLRMLGLLRADGPATATMLAGRLELNTGATSYHLRQLAQHGFIEEDTERGNARDRWWRATHEATRTDFRGEGIADDVEAYLTTVAMMYADRMRAVVVRAAVLPEQWQGVGTLSDWELHADARRARRRWSRPSPRGRVEEVEDSTEDGAAPFVVNLNAYLEPGSARPPGAGVSAAVTTRTPLVGGAGRRGHLLRRHPRSR